jgi:hypothetical protein
MKQPQKPKGDRVELAVVGLATMTMICLTVVNFKAEPEKDLSSFNTICLAVLTGCIAFVRGGEMGEFLNSNFTISPRTSTRREVTMEYEERLPSTKPKKYIEYSEDENL